MKSKPPQEERPTLANNTSQDANQPPGTRPFKYKKDRRGMPFKRNQTVKIGPYHFRIVRVTPKGQVALEPLWVEVAEADPVYVMGE
jgi:hypothetical protein